MAGREKIILVDDNVVNLTIGKHALGGEYDLLTVPSGEKLFKALGVIHPNLILLDVDMPGMDGFDILIRLKNETAFKDIPVVFLSARDDDATMEKCFRLGAVDFVTKPYLHQHLAAVVRCHLLLQSQQRALTSSALILEEAVEKKKHAIIDLQNVVLTTLVGLAESRGSDLANTLTNKIGLEKPLGALIKEMMIESKYKQELTRWDIDLFTASAHFHDIGKIIIKDNILLKPSRLTPEEFNQMKMHTVYGVRLIESIEQDAAQWNFFTSAKLFASAHHERWDGSGYPHGLHGENIPLQGRLMAILDVYNALVSERPYKKPVSPHEARAIIAKGRGTLFDPLLVDIFLSLPSL